MFNLLTGLNGRTHIFRHKYTPCTICPVNGIGTIYRRQGGLIGDPGFSWGRHWHISLLPVSHNVKWYFMLFTRQYIHHPTRVRVTTKQPCGSIIYERDIYRHKQVISVSIIVPLPTGNYLSGKKFSLYNLCTCRGRENICTIIVSGVISF